jgi:TATA-binding protein-associated factor
LLETGSTRLIRDTAAKQLADLQKQHPDELFNLLSRVVPFLRSPKWETRIAASKALEGIVDNVPKFDPNEDEDEAAKPEVDIKFEENGTNGHAKATSGESDLLSLEALDLPSVLKLGKKLVGSGGKEYDYALAALDPASRLAHQKKSLSSRLGMGGDYMEEDILADKDLVFDLNGSAPKKPKLDTNIPTMSRVNSMHSPAPPTAVESPANGEPVSKRMLNKLKRKNKAMTKDQVRNMRTFDFAIGGRRESETSGASVPPLEESHSEIKSEDDVELKSDMLSLDRAGGDDQSTVVSQFKGAIAPERPEMQADAEDEGLEWPFERLCDILSVDLFDHNWEIRHGAAMALRDIVNTHGAGGGRRRGKSRAENDALNAAWLDDLACRYCCVLALDRFGDYISDNVVAPIREAVGLALGTLLKHLPPTKLNLVYDALHRMVMQQDFGMDRHVWQVRHGGMLGLKYLGAVRKDVLMHHLNGIVDAVRTGLADEDDDVRAVSAGTLEPIAEDLVRLRPNLLPALMNLVWDCLAETRDDLSASTGQVMDLLAKLCSFEPAILAMQENAAADAAMGNMEHSFHQLIPRLYPFLRHTLASVRGAVLRALLTFLRIEVTGARDWVDGKILRLVFQNLLVERYDDVLELSFKVWTALGDFLVSSSRFTPEFQSHCEALLSLTLHPVGVPRHPIPMDLSLIMKPSGQFLAEPAPVPGRKQSSPGEPPTKKRRRQSEKKDDAMPKATHNVDGHMLKGEIDLVGFDILMRSRMYAARAMGKAMQHSAPDQRLLAQIMDGLRSDYASTRMVAAMVLEEQCRASNGPVAAFVELAQQLQLVINGDIPEAYREQVGYLQIVRAQCQNLLNALRDHGKILPKKIPIIPPVVKGDADAGPNAFSIENAESIAHKDFDRLYAMIQRGTQLTAGPHIKEIRTTVLIAIEEAKRIKDQGDVRVKAAASGALIANRDIPTKAAKLIRASMDGVKTEENVALQKRFATGVSSLLEHYARQGGSAVAPSKIVANVVLFYNNDTSDAPEYPANKELTDDILSMQKDEDRKDIQDTAQYEREERAARITSRGGKEVLNQLCHKFGADLFNNTPNLQKKIADPLRQVFERNEDIDREIDDQLGQEAVDAFSLLRGLAPNLHPGLHSFVDEMMPAVLAALRCRLSVLRYAAAKCFAAICSVWPVKCMTLMVEKVLPVIGNPLSLQHRQGAIETVYHLISTMEDGILPYVVFLIVPILGRMSDSNNDVRLIATTTFATLVKLVPLEAGIPDPPGFSEELLRGRDKERKFVSQMLDPKKTDAFEIPVAIKAKLRSYQQDGVNWLYFLNRFNLHGVLCDDMGLGKTLQTLCMVASDHHIRAQEYAKTQAPELRRLPSLIVCPPTLSGHWEQEIQQFAPFLKAVAYVGAPANRNPIRPQLSSCDIVITSYEVCRNDIEILAGLDWNYCVLDEGHLIKNPRAKTSIAVKRLNSYHRLILSGTPIQNNVLELWSLFDFLMPGFLGTEKVFHERYSKPIAASRNAKSSSKEQEKGALAIESLHKQVLPFLLRRLKEDVLDDLPPKIIQNYYCDLSDLQKRLFEDFAKTERKNIESQAGDESKEAKQHIFQALQYMRKLCNSPSLVVKEGHKNYDSIQSQLKSSKSSLTDVAHAPKLTALRDLLVDCGIGTPPPAEGELGSGENYVSPHRALVFCQMKEMLDIVQSDVLRKLLPSVQFLRLDGSVEANKRQAIVNQFNSDPSYDVLLLTTSVGGLGLNLTGADTVIFVEHDWNPQKDMQAMDRAHRIGQKKVVNVYRLVTRGTLEEKILKYAISFLSYLASTAADIRSTVSNGSRSTSPPPSSTSKTPASTQWTLGRFWTCSTSIRQTLEKRARVRRKTWSTPQPVSLGRRVKRAYWTIWASSGTKTSTRKSTTSMASWPRWINRVWAFLANGVWRDVSSVVWSNGFFLTSVHTSLGSGPMVGGVDGL